MQQNLGEPAPRYYLKQARPQLFENTTVNVYQPLNDAAIFFPNMISFYDVFFQDGCNILAWNWSNNITMLLALLISMA